MSIRKGAFAARTTLIGNKIAARRSMPSLLLSAACREDERCGRGEVAGRRRCCLENVKADENRQHPKSPMKKRVAEGGNCRRLPE